MTHLADEKEIVCQSCGGHTTFVGTLTTTKCPYCATPIQRTDIHEAPDRLAVDGVLPFAITEKAATEALRAWVNKRWFAPNEFKKYSTFGSFESVYTAYFTFDAAAVTRYQGERGITRTRTVGHGENRRTETYTTWHRASGVVHNEFDDIVIGANTGFDDRRIAKLEPWPTHQVRPFSGDYLAGHLARTYDRDLDECHRDARHQMDGVIDSTVRQDIGGDQQRVHNKQSTFRNETYKHLLLPIWLLTVLYQAKPYQVYMNGVTGEIHGERPWSKVKIALAVVAAIIVVAVIALLIAANQ